MDIRGKVILVTGASMGIGLATVRRFVDAGARVVLVARSTDTIEQAADELRHAGHDALVVTADVRDPAAVARMVDATIARYGRLDVLVNNAGQAAAGRIADINPDDYRSIIELNLFGALYAMQAAIPAMRNGGGGIIVNISSMTSKMTLPGYAAYASTKAALNLMSATARAELAPDNIRVITVYPRLTATDFGKNSLGNQQVRQNNMANRPANITIDSAEHVATKIAEAVEKEPAEQYME